MTTHRTATHPVKVLFPLGGYLICARLYALGSIVTVGFVQARATLWE
jgi:hypothetical protein